MISLLHRHNPVNSQEERIWWHKIYFLQPCIFRCKWVCVKKGISYRTSARTTAS